MGVMVTGRKDEPVRIERKRFAFLPDAFLWRGRRYDVRRVERCWTLVHGTGGRRVERRYFRVRCDDGTYDLCHDLVANLWLLSAAQADRPSAFDVRTCGWR